MKCQSCDKNPATVHITDIAEGAKTTVDLCEECAGKKGLGSGSAIPSLLQALVEGTKASSSSARCPTCGISFEEFRAKGRLGCPNDYEVFAEDLKPMLEKIHGAAKHSGRVPKGAGTDTVREDRVLRLRRDLERAKEEERYEDAAKIRDEIRAAEETLRGSR